MSDHVFQDRKGQTFEQAIRAFLTCRIEVSGYEPKVCAGGRYWWAVVQTPEGEYEAIAGRVSAFDGQGWGYKIERAHNYPALTNPPLEVRKALISRGVPVAGVYEPGVTSEKFALMMRDELVETIAEAIEVKDDAYLLEAIASLKTTAARIITEVAEEKSSTIGRTPVVLPEAVLDAVIEHVDSESGKYLMWLRTRHQYPLTQEQSERVGEVLDPVYKERLLATY